MPLIIDGQQVRGPRRGTPTAQTTAALYTELDADNSWDKAISTYLKEVVEIKSVYDFLTAFKTDKDWDNFFDAEIKDAGGRALGRGAKGRVLQAYEVIKDARDAAARIKTQGEDTRDLDAPLKSDGNDQPIFKVPGDALISRVAKEREWRFLHITDVLKVKGVETERRAQARKQEVGKRLPYTQPAGAVAESRPETVTCYLNALGMYMLAVAVWGSKLRDPPGHNGAPVVETRDADPENYVEFPWQSSINFFHRATITGRPRSSTC